MERKALSLAMCSICNSAMVLEVKGEEGPLPRCIVCNSGIHLIKDVLALNVEEQDNE